MSEIIPVLTENRLFPPSIEFSTKANINSEEQYQKMLLSAEENYPEYWAKLARQYITWHKPFSIILNEQTPPFYKWFEDGKLNVSYNCLDRHAATDPHKSALIFEADDGQIKHTSYLELLHQVCKFANGLKSLGIKSGDRVIIYLPNSIEAIVAMQACARIGAIHSVVFGGFSAHAVNARIKDAQAKLIITADGQHRGGKLFPLKVDIDHALAISGAETIEHVIIHRRTGEINSWHESRDIWWHELVANQSANCEPEWVDAEHPLFILYTSGSTGTPKGIQHSSGGYLLGAIVTMQWVFDIKPNDVYWCTADVGWITGHTYLCYGPLAVGATQVIFEGIPTYPDNRRFWQMIERHRVSIFYTSPTAIRSLIKLGADLPNDFDLSSLRLLGSVGEPINPEAWMWYYQVIGKSRCPIVDTWWQTETGANILAPVPGITVLIPGSCTRPIPGICIAILDDDGKIMDDHNGGNLVITKPFPFQARTIWNDQERFAKTYYNKRFGSGKYYLSGDAAYCDCHGYYHILGRTDDVIKVSGHRISATEIESALVANHRVNEAAAIGIPHAIKGEVIVAFVVLKEPLPSEEILVTLANELRLWVANEIGALARPEEIRFSEALPKTRSGKIMRRLLRTIATGEPITQDISTLDNPAIIKQMEKH